jgi:hypothetical protein
MKHFTKTTTYTKLVVMYKNAINYAERRCIKTKARKFPNFKQSDFVRKTGRIYSRKYIYANKVREYNNSRNPIIRRRIKWLLKDYPEFNNNDFLRMPCKYAYGELVKKFNTGPIHMRSTLKHIALYAYSDVFDAADFPKKDFAILKKVYSYTDLVAKFKTCKNSERGNIRTLAKRRPEYNPIDFPYIRRRYNRRKK